MGEGIGAEDAKMSKPGRSSCHSNKATSSRPDLNDTVVKYLRLHAKHVGSTRKILTGTHKAISKK